MNSRRLAGSAALLTSAFLWATGYLAVKQMVEDVAPCLLLAMRFSLSAVILLVLFLPKLKKLTRGTLATGIRMGAALFFEFFCYTVGLQYTTVAKTSFIIASYIILLPIVYFIIRKKLISRGDILCSILCMAGLGLILADGVGGFNRGDLFGVFSALFYAVHIVYSAQYAKEYDGGLLNLVQIATAAVLALAAALISGDFFVADVTAAFPPFWSVLYLAVVCTILPYVFCLLGMKYVSTMTSGILLSFESVFATILSVILLNERLYWQLVAGGAIILAAVILSEVFAVLPASKRRRQE